MFVAVQRMRNTSVDRPPQAVFPSAALVTGECNPSYFALRVSPRGRASTWWASAEAVADDAPEAIRVLLAGRVRVEVTADEALEALAWAATLAGWAEGPRPLWVYPFDPA